MNELIIKLKGEIQSSNFDEWKRGLIAQIQSTNTELATDDDFVTATTHVKLFKAAEKSLKEAKQSAIEQAADIQKLFAAIDEISEEARQARLSLERQIKVRKLEIREEFIKSGFEIVRTCIEQENDDFQLTDHSGYLDRRRFESAVKSKASNKGMQSAVNELCDKIRSEISNKAAEVKNNRKAIDALPRKYALLFQDRSSLLELTKRELELTIDKRIALFNEENSKIIAEKAIQELKKLEDVELNADNTLHPENEKISEKENYRLIVDISASKDTAIEIARSIRQAYAHNASISSIRLTRVHGD